MTVYQTPAPLQATAKGTAIVESSGGKQIGYIGMPLDQPVVVQVNDSNGSAVAGAAVYFSGPAGVRFTPGQALTDSSGRVTTIVALGQPHCARTCPCLTWSSSFAGPDRCQNSRNTACG